MNIIKYNYLKFKHWLNFQPPYSLTFEEWNSFNEDFKKNAPIRFYIKNNIIPKFFIFIRIFSRINQYIHYKIKKYHVIDTGLKPGYYYDRDARILHGCFNTLKDYVEVEKAWIHLICDTEDSTHWKFKIPYYRYFYRNKEYGLKYLEWESSLDDPSLPPADRCESQAESAREVIKLYNWWTCEREKNHKELEKISDYNLLHETEEKLQNEDDEMLIRLIKIRRTLWT